jgi:hypothetical protein
VEQSSITESDDDIAVVETDDPFFGDPRNDSSKLSKKLSDEVRVRVFFFRSLLSAISFTSVLHGLMISQPLVKGSKKHNSLFEAVQLRLTSRTQKMRTTRQAFALQA